jgi:Fur family transcriptional regulator, zinc uptake regulator
MTKEWNFLQTNQESKMNTTAKIKRHLLQIEEICEKTGARLTPIRRDLLSLICSQKRHVTAYELLRLIRKTYPKTEAMTVYRALNFLQKHFLIHRIDSQNAYTYCDTPAQIHHPQILLCKDCGNTKEVNIDFLEKSLKKAAKQHNFALSNKPIEITGTCEHCRKAENHGAD